LEKSFSLKGITKMQEHKPACRIDPFEVRIEGAEMID
jgi:hypothetical protein